MSSSAAPLEDDGISLCLKHSIDDRGAYQEFTAISVDILLNQENDKPETIGSIQAVLIDRTKIPQDRFLESMDSHSGELEAVATNVFEPELGRTRLQSLAAHDDRKKGILYIRSLDMDKPKCLGTLDDLGAMALRQFLHHSFIKDKVALAVYILDARANMTAEEKVEAEMDEIENFHYQMMMQDESGTVPELDGQAEAEKKLQIQQGERLDANKFLRNGFFQDQALARHGEERYLVASHAHWSRAKLLSQAEADTVQFYVSSPQPPEPTGKDAEILRAVKRTCETLEEVHDTYERLEALSNLWETVCRCMEEGGSLVRSHAIHAACAHNNFDIVNSCLRTDPSVVNSLDASNSPPLTFAALNAAGRCNKDGVSETRVIDKLLGSGARLDFQDEFGMTAYGQFKRERKHYDRIFRSIRRGWPRGTHPTVQAVERKLRPPNGPTSADKAGGQGPESGFVDYTSRKRQRS